MKKKPLKANKHMEKKTFTTLNDIATQLRKELKEKKYILIFAYNGIGKTRLSMNFKEIGKNNGTPDTLYFNAFTEDLFSWDNDLNNNEQRMLCINQNSRFFDGLQELEMENRIRPLLHRYVDFDFYIDYNQWTIHFRREIEQENSTQTVEDIKISRGEESIFIWCFFLAIVQLAIDEQEAYNWVKYIYIDDPISSIDDNNAIGIASHLAQLLKKPNNKIKTVISSHHSLFFNVIANELKNSTKYFFNHNKNESIYTLENTQNTPNFHHIVLLKELHRVAESGEIYTYHFNILRNILEKIATFHGFNSFSDCIKKDEKDIEGIIHTRIINILNHGNYSLFDAREMLEENKEHFRKILYGLMENHRFNPDLFPTYVKNKK